MIAFGFSAEGNTENELMVPPLCRPPLVVLLRWLLCGLWLRFQVLHYQERSALSHSEGEREDSESIVEGYESRMYPGAALFEKMHGAKSEPPNIGHNVLFIALSLSIYFI